MRPWRGLKECVAEHPALKVWPQRSGPGSIQQSSHVQVMLVRQPRNAELEALTWTMYLNGVWRHCAWIWSGLISDLFRLYEVPVLLEASNKFNLWRHDCLYLECGERSHGLRPRHKKSVHTEVTSMNSSIQSKGPRSPGATPHKFSPPPPEIGVSPISLKSSIYRCSHRPLLIFLSDRSPQTHITRA